MSRVEAEEKGSLRKTFRGKAVCVVERFTKQFFCGQAHNYNYAPQEKLCGEIIGCDCEHVSVQRTIHN